MISQSFICPEYSVWAQWPTGKGEEELLLMSVNAASGLKSAASIEHVGLISEEGEGTMEKKQKAHHEAI